MKLTPLRARLAFGALLVASLSISVNVLWFQDDVGTPVRAKTEKARQRAEVERTRRLALAPRVAPDATPAQPDAAATIAQPRARTAETRRTESAPTGSFTPSAATLDPPLGKPAAPSAPTVLPEADTGPDDRTRRIQTELAARGYEPGVPDGVIGLITRAAIMAFEHDLGLPLTGEASPEVLAHLRNEPPPLRATQTAARARAPHAETLIRSAQQALQNAGYFHGTIDGRMSEDTNRAITAFEIQSGLVPTGRISAPLMMRLSRAQPSPRTAVR